MRILITGGAGFIASHIADAYIAARHSVSVIDNLTTGSKKNVNPQARLYIGDIRDLSFVTRVMKKERPQIVNHHAALVSVVESMRNPKETIEVNVIGTANIVSAFGLQKTNGKKKLVIASTGGALYGEPSHLPAKETTLISPLSPYGLSKLLAEETVAYYANTLHFDFTILRYANVYGPRQDAHGEAGVVAIFSNLMKQNKRPTIFGDGTKTRDYVFVKDVVDANMRALRKGAGERMNIGCGKEITDKEVFDAIAKALTFTKPPIFAPFRSGEVRRIMLDAKKARAILGWKPRVIFTEGITQSAPLL